ncbi:hypothetical protein MKK70_16710 [Methylobacterium sp. E-041]|uniref:hypothetical protein n=1 Tax=Methylobacterium sp. E-041 TaxID=2836573 RepID=UPI001FB865FB|nr:hypothetical protein [Methylobacterium sp. E-041]MCJ2106988.1 hypothetical protein [Methylobacterium sp. E-041]
MKHHAILSATIADNACRLHLQRLQKKRSDAMALLSTLVERIAEIEGVETAYASGVARYLREAGLLTQAGRGRGAAHMSSFDAARFLIGLNSSITAKDAPKFVKYFGDLKNVWKTQTEYPGVCEEGQSLLSAIVELVEICGKPELKLKLESAELEIEVQFNRPVAHVFILINETTEDEFGIPSTRRVGRGLYGSPIALAKRSTPDRREVITISQRTLLVVSDVISK